MTDFADRLGESIEAALETRLHFWTTSQKGEKWLQVLCPFHDDKTPSGRWQPANHVFYCHACSRTFTLMELAHALNVAVPTMTKIVTPPPLVIAPPLNGPVFEAREKPGVPVLVSLSPPSSPEPERGLSAVPEQKTTKYEYRFPDGRLSHIVNRLEVGGSKEFPCEHPDGTPGLPKEHYPIYQPVAIQPGDYVVVVEGEKCVEAVEAVHDKTDHPIHAMTWGGGSGAAKKYVFQIANHLQKLQPGRIILWPDNDEPGYKAMETIATTLRKLGIRYVVISPNDLGLELRQDVADYLAHGKSLAGVVQQFQQEGSAEVAGLMQKTLITQDEFVIVERRLYPLDHSRLDMLWHDAYGVLPKRDQQRELHTALATKARQHPTQVVYRTCADIDSFYWRTLPTGRCLRISGKGVEMADDPPGWVILVRPGLDPYSAGYASGTKTDFDTWFDQFHLTTTNKQLLEAWLCCTLLNLQTPFLLLRGPAGTGKTTLARSILAIVEPGVPEMPLTTAATHDERGLIRALSLTRALLLDNVSKLPPGTEDLLSKLVTGANIQLRTLYTDAVESLHYRRSIVMTTIGYDIYQSDLSDRTIAMTPQLHEEHVYGSAARMKQMLDESMDKIRGYIFSQCSRFYQRRATVAQDSQFRVGDLGWVLATLGYDTVQIAKDVQASHRELVVQHDAWLDAIIEIVRSHGGDEWTVPTKALTREIGQRLEMNDISTIGLGRYLQEKEAQFRDYGFTVESKRGHGGMRLWRFSKL